MSLLENLNWRYATKKYDPTKKVSQEDVDKIVEAARITSYNVCYTKLLRRLAKLLSVMKPGDYLFIEFAHNDQKPGGNHVDPYTTYQEQVRYYINEARKRGGKPVLVTSTARRAFDESDKIKNTLLEYPDAMRQLAKEENLPLIDLNAMTKVFYETLGVENSKHALVHYPANTFPGQNKPLEA